MVWMPQIVRDRSHRFVGARVENLNDVLKAVAMDYDYVITRPVQLESLLVNGEARLPIYVEGVPGLRLEDKGAHGEALIIKHRKNLATILCSTSRAEHFQLFRCHTHRGPGSPSIT